MTRTVTSTPAAPPPVRETAKTVGWSLLFYAGAQLAGYFLARNAVGAAAVEAALAEWGAGRLAIAWSDPLAPVPSWRAILRRAAHGAGLGLGAGALVLVILLVTHAAALAATAPAPSQLAVGLLLAALIAVRDELFLRGFVLRALAGWPSPTGCALACGVASAAAALGVPGKTPVEIAMAGVTGVAFASLWQRDRGAWAAVGAHIAWLFATGALVRGGLLDVRFALTSWGGGDAGIGGSALALCVLFPIAIASTVWAGGPRAPSGPATPP